MFAQYTVMLFLIRLNIPILFPALVITYFTWAFQLTCSSNVTPKYLNSETRFIVHPLTWMLKQFAFLSFAQVPNNIDSVFPAFKNRLLSRNQESTRFISSLIFFSIVAISVPEENNTVSSAYNNMLQWRVAWFGKSLICIINRRGPKNEPQQLQVHGRK